jgi:hypothetical protein
VRAPSVFLHYGKCRRRFCSNIGFGLASVLKTTVPMLRPDPTITAKRTIMPCVNEAGDAVEVLTSLKVAQTLHDF